MVAIMAEKDSLANKYAADAPYGAIFTADPGTSGTATGEVTGGSPAYARVALGWTTASGTGIVTGSGVFNVPASTTVTFAAACSSNVAGAATLRDKVAVTSQAFASQGTYTVAYSFTVT